MIFRFYSSGWYLRLWFWNCHCIKEHSWIQSSWHCGTSIIYLFFNTYLCMNIFIDLSMTILTTTIHHWCILYVVREQLWELLEIVDKCVRFLSGFWTTKPEYSQTQTQRINVGTFWHPAFARDKYIDNRFNERSFLVVINQ